MKKIFSLFLGKKIFSPKVFILSSFFLTFAFHVFGLIESIKPKWGVEITWGLITPKNVTPSSAIQNIVLGSIYSKPDSRFKTDTLDHIA